MKKASEAERESTKYFHTLFVQEYIGEEFDGVVSGIATMECMSVWMKIIAGMVPMNAIPGDRFHFDQDSLESLVHELRKNILGDRWVGYMRLVPEKDRWI